MGKKIFTFNGIEFDDVMNDVHGKWAVICKNCVAKHKIDRTRIDDYATVNEICGVKGCNNMANYYIEFGKDRIQKTTIKQKPINIVTPPINISNNKHFNVLVSNTSERKVGSVLYNTDKGYIIITKDAVTPDVMIDENTVDTLVKAHMRKRQMESLIEYCEASDHINLSILRDTRTLIAIVESIPIDAGVNMEQIAHICNTSPCAQPYMTK